MKKFLGGDTPCSPSIIIVVNWVSIGPALAIFFSLDSLTTLMLPEPILSKSAKDTIYLDWLRSILLSASRIDSFRFALVVITPFRASLSSVYRFRPIRQTRVIIRDPGHSPYFKKAQGGGIWMAYSMGTCTSTWVPISTWLYTSI